MGGTYFALGHLRVGGREGPDVPAPQLPSPTPPQAKSGAPPGPPRWSPSATRSLPRVGARFQFAIASDDGPSSCAGARDAYGCVPDPGSMRGGNTEQAMGALPKTIRL